jgi:hypothetical protein
MQDEKNEDLSRPMPDVNSGSSTEPTDATPKDSNPTDATPADEAASDPNAQQ